MTLIEGVLLGSASGLAVATWWVAGFETWSLRLFWLVPLGGIGGLVSWWLFFS